MRLLLKKIPLNVLLEIREIVWLAAINGEVMYLANMKISNFRIFGEEGIELTFNKGVTAFVGPNDSGKTAVIDAIRLVLLTRDHEYFRLQQEDFHIEPGDNPYQAKSFSIFCKFKDLNDSEKGTFLEFLSYDGKEVYLCITLTVIRLTDGEISRRQFDISVRCGKDGVGPVLDSTARELLSAAYLRPLRDAEREMSPGKNSRLSQILMNLDTIKDGSKFDPTPSVALNVDEIKKLSLLGLSVMFSHFIREHAVISEIKDSINTCCLDKLSLAKDNMKGEIDFVSATSENIRLKNVLERLELKVGSASGKMGLGSNNLLFMACELLLLGSEKEGFPLLLIEEPEAHLHPQRQMRLLDFLINASKGSSDNVQAVQVILTTHSPNITSKLPIENLVMLVGNNAFPLGAEFTKLDPGDYTFLERFLDVTKANLFFANGLLIVEGDAEALLLPTLAKCLGVDLSEHGVSIVNVGHTGLSRYSKIFQRSNADAPIIPIHVACLADRDIMPDCAPKMLKIVENDDDEKWENSKRKWLAEKDNKSEQQIKRLMKNDGQKVKTFVSDHWTLEYDIAFSGLAKYVYIASRLVKCKICLQDKRMEKIRERIEKQYQKIEKKYEGKEMEYLATEVYSAFHSSASPKISKSINAQYLAWLLAEALDNKELNIEYFKENLPKYLIHAIEYAAGVKIIEK